MPSRSRVTVWKRSPGAPSGTPRSGASSASMPTATTRCSASPSSTPNRSSSTSNSDASGEVDAVDAVEALERQVDLLDRHRPAVGGPHAIEPEAAVARPHLERRGEKAVGRDDLARGDRRARRLPAREHVLREGGERAGLRDPRLGDEGAASMQPVHRALRRQPLDLVAHGHAREPVAFGQLALGRQRRAGRKCGEQLLEDRPERLPLRRAAREPAGSAAPSESPAQPSALPSAVAAAEPARELFRIRDGGAHDDREGTRLAGRPHVLRRAVAALGQDRDVEP